MEVPCEFGMNAWNNGLTLRYACWVTTSVEITAKNSKIKSFKGFHLPGKSDSDVKVLFIQHTIVNFFPRGLSTIFPQLDALAVRDCGMKEITREDLEGLENLATLSLDFNNIKSLPNDLLRGMRRLRFVDFRNNKLEQVNPLVLEPIRHNKLKYVDFRGNKNIDVVFEPMEGLAFVKHLPSFQHLIEALHLTQDLKCSKANEVNTMDKDKYLENVTRTFKELRISGKFSDLVLTVGVKKFHVHKSILATQSPKLAAIIEDKVDELKLEDVTEKDVEDFLHYVYTGEMCDGANHTGIFGIAAKLGASTLTSICERKILDNVNQSNATNVFFLGCAHGSEKMKLEAFKEIKKMFPGKTLSDDLMNKPEILRELIETRRNADYMFQKFQHLMKNN